MVNSGCDTYWYFKVWSNGTFKNERDSIMDEEVVEFFWTQIDVFQVYIAWKEWLY